MYTYQAMDWQRDSTGFKKSENLNGEDLMNVLETGGWEAILPTGLSDKQLVHLVDQLRGFLWGEGELGPSEETSAAITPALLLLMKIDPSFAPFDESLPLGGGERLLRDLLLVLHVAANQEIVNRLLKRPLEAESLAILTGICTEINVSSAQSASFQ